MSTPVSDKQLLAPKDVADALDVNVVTVRRAIKSGELEAVRLGEHGSYRVSRQAVERFLRPVKAGS